MRRGCRKVTRAFRAKPSHNRLASSVTAPKKRPHSSARTKAKTGQSSEGEPASWQAKWRFGLKPGRPRRGARHPPGLSISCICPATRSASASSSARCSSCSARSPRSISSGCRQAGSDKDWKDAAHSLKGSASRHRRLACRRGCRTRRGAVGRGPGRKAADLRLRDIESAVREAETYIGTLLKDR